MLKYFKAVNNYFKPKLFVKKLLAEFIFNKMISSPFRKCLIRKKLSIPHTHFHISEHFRCDIANFDIGEYSFINSFFTCLGYKEARLSIGKYTQIASSVTVILSTHNVNDMSHEFGDVIIGDKCWIGANVTILPGVTIGEGAVIGASSLVNKDVEPYTIYAGTPAKYIKDRQITYPYHLARGGFLLEDGTVSFEKKA